MSTVIYKYPLDLDGPDIKEIRMPVGANVLSVQVQRDAVCLWALVPTDTAALVDIEETRRFLMIGTGHRLPERPDRFIGTVQLVGGALVLHVFELEKARR